MNRAVILLVGLVVIASFPLLSAEAGGTDVLFDLSKEADTLYGNPEVQGDMLCSMLEGEGITYAFTERGRSLALYALSSYRILVIWDPDGPYDENERTAIISFVEQGGILLFAGTSFYNTPDTIYVNCNELLTTFGITLVREQVLDKTDYIGCHCGTTPSSTRSPRDTSFMTFPTWRAITPGASRRCIRSSIALVIMIRL